MNHATYVGVGTVLIWGFGVAYTKGGGGYCGNAEHWHDGQKAMTAVRQARPEPNGDTAPGPIEAPDPGSIPGSPTWDINPWTCPWLVNPTPTPHPHPLADAVLIDIPGGHKVAGKQSASLKYHPQPWVTGPGGRSTSPGMGEDPQETPPLTRPVGRALRGAHGLRWQVIQGHPGQVAVGAAGRRAGRRRITRGRSHSALDHFLI